MPFPVVVWDVMKRTVAIGLALLTLVATAGVGSAAALGVGDVGSTNAVDAQNETNESDIPPGAQLSAVIGVQESEIEGSIESRAFGIAVANATTNESKAEVVAKQLEQNRERLAELRERKQELKEQRKAGNISEGEYKAKMAKIAAETATIQRTTNQSANVTEELPTSVLEEQGINVSAIRTLKQNASELSGGEVAEIAQSIAGKRTGQPGGAPEGVGERGEAGDRGEEGDRGAQNASQQIDRAAQTVDRARERIAAAEKQVGENDTEAQAALEDAREALSKAETALADARSQAEDDPEAASERAQAALEHAKTAISHAEEAMELAGGGTGDGGGAGTETGTGGGSGTGDGGGTSGTETSGTETGGTGGA